ncbi:hypothetical protein [Flavobacterium sp. CS20]|jgi:hypothetical protein|uniref:hypothetical protein n=1 Tax=Flavobacterium sp. CS20 TaxID=2775246 RepID=UPI001B3A0A0D|nr:hypothetical protein [Flavobacterium sp. CS20]QTY27459.1 hypothetical protein IGB25_02540 [Flavobacterium sp. CS20]
MKYPRFLLADNSEADTIYVVHTEFPRFILNINTDELEFWETFDEDEVKEEYDTLVKEAFDFYDNEIEQYSK